MAGAWSGGTWWRSPGWPNPHWVYGNATALSNPAYRTTESMALNVPPAVLKSSGGLGAPPTMVGAGPTYAMKWTDANGNAINQAVCGSVYGWTIPGMEGSTVYLVQTKNGSAQFSGNFPVPMPNYSSICNQDEGLYQAYAYSLTDGSLVASGTFTVLPQGSSATAPATGSTTPVPGATTATGSTLSVIEGMFSNLTASDWLLIAAGLLVLFRGGRSGGG